MNAGRFERERARIEAKGGRSNKWRKRAMQHLLKNAGAEFISSGKRVVAYRMTDGTVACQKRRFKSEAAALATLRQIAAEAQPRTSQPIRAYPCKHCQGWHLTSMKDRNEASQIEGRI